MNGRIVECQRACQFTTESRPNLNPRPIGHRPPNFFDLSVSHRDATGRPIAAAMQRPHPTAAIGQSMNHDITPRRDPILRGTGDIVRIGIRDMQGAMKITILLMPVDQIDSLRRPLIALLLLRSNRGAAQSYPITLQRGRATEERQPPGRLLHQDAVGSRFGRKRMPLILQTEKCHGDADRGNQQKK